ITRSGTNVFCRYDECDISTVFTKDCDENQECAQFVKVGAAYQCPDQYESWKSYDLESWEEIGTENSGKFMCCQGRIV
ncbi:hypothetical protein PFISCL1PPCAC_1663, partial [Pristionchus fissidentatus]